MELSGRHRLLGFGARSFCARGCGPPSSAGALRWIQVLRGSCLRELKPSEKEVSLAKFLSMCLGAVTNFPAPWRLTKRWLPCDQSFG